MTKRACFCTSLLLAVSMLWPAQEALAQLTTGGIVGTVTDPPGSRIPQVSVTLTEVDTGTSTTVLTDGSGNYSVVVPLGASIVSHLGPPYLLVARVSDIGARLASAPTLTLVAHGPPFRELWQRGQSR